MNTVRDSMLPFVTSEHTGGPQLTPRPTGPTTTDGPTHTHTHGGVTGTSPLSPTGPQNDVGRPRPETLPPNGDRTRRKRNRKTGTRKNGLGELKE